MGDFADMALQETMIMEGLRFDYRMGFMSDQQAFDEGIIDHLGREEYVPMFRPARKTLSCRHCGSTKVRWQATPAGWRLFDGSSMHACPKFAKAEGK
jgi:hypothetical protein